MVAAYSGGDGPRMSLNACSHKVSGIAFTGFRKIHDLGGDGLFDAVVAVSNP